MAASLYVRLYGSRLLQMGRHYIFGGTFLTGMMFTLSLTLPLWTLHDTFGRLKCCSMISGLTSSWQADSEISV